jgi:hypothetical protein
MQPTFNLKKTTIIFNDKNGNIFSFDTSMSELQPSVIDDMLNGEIEKYKKANGIKGRHGIIDYFQD